MMLTGLTGCGSQFEGQTSGSNESSSSLGEFDLDISIAAAADSHAAGSDIYILAVVAGNERNIVRYDPLKHVFVTRQHR